MKRLLPFLLLVALLFALWRKQPSGPILLAGRAMGCEWKLLTDENVDRVQLQSEIAAVLERWEQVLSTWRGDSDLSCYNRGEPASEDLSRVLELAEQLRLDTGGAFDHRMLAQLGKAGFGPGGTGVDLSSLGKGFAVDRVCELLRSRGIHRHVFSLAGEVRAGEGDWAVGIEGPDGLAETVSLSKQAMASSGNHRQWRESKNGRLVSHLLDPATGEPVLRPPCSVTVIGPDAAHASAWATAFFVRGPGTCPPGLKVVWLGRAD